MSKKINWRFYFNFTKLLTIAVYLGGTGIALMQMIQIVQQYIREPVVTRAIPTQNIELARPNMIVCVNVYTTYLHYTHRRLKPHLVQLIAALGKDKSAYLRSSFPQFLNISTEKHTEIGREVKNLAHSVGNCTDILGNCVVLEDGFSLHEAWSCCKSAERVQSARDVCYVIRPNSTQSQEGRENSFLMEMYFPSMKAVEYALYLSHDYSPTRVRQIVFQPPTTTIGPNTEVHIGVSLQENRFLNSSTSQCTNNARLVSPDCQVNVLIGMVNDKCNCDARLPFWDDSVDESRRCEFLQDNRCALEAFRNNYSTFVSRMSQCYRKACKQTVLLAKQNIRKARPYFRSFDGVHEEEHSFSLVYVFYNSMITTIEEEVTLSTWTSAMSSLGGIWGLWLGWSVCGIIRLIIMMSTGIVTHLQTRVMSSTVQGRKSDKVEPTAFINIEPLWY